MGARKRTQWRACGKDCYVSDIGTVSRAEGRGDWFAYILKQPTSSHQLENRPSVRVGSYYVSHQSAKKAVLRYWKERAQPSLPEGI